MPSAHFIRQANQTSSVNGDGNTRAEVLFLNGNQVGDTANEGCTKDDTPVQCAIKYMSSVHTPPDDIQRGLKHIWNSNKNTVLRVVYDSEFAGCTSEDPVMVHHDDLYICSVASCAYEYTQSIATTNTQRNGLKLGLTAKTTGQVTKILKTEITASTEWSGEWTSSTVNTATVKKTLTLTRGDVCAWTNYQLSIKCLSQPTIHDFTIYNPDGTMAFPAFPNLCTAFDEDVKRANFIRGQGFSSDVANTANNVCSSIAVADPSRNFSLAVPNGDQDGTIWHVQGCMTK